MRVECCSQTAGRLLALAVLAAACAPASAQSARYERNLLRLSEILGSMHYLQQMCGAFDDDTWRRQMVSLMQVEKVEGEREAHLIARFNRGYRKYKDWFSSCTDGARAEIDRHTREGSELTTWLADNRR